MTLPIKPLFATVLALAFTACATSSPYREAEGRGYGYAERQLSAEHYRIQFKARGDDAGKAMDYAMLRASEVALENDFDWFVIISRDTRVNNENISPALAAGSSYNAHTFRACGLLTCSTYSRPVQHHPAATLSRDSRAEVEVVLEVRMGNGAKPSELESYDSSEVYQQISAVK